MPTDGHWLWTDSPTSDGYGQVVWEGQHWLVHRLVWHLLGGELPENLHHDGCPHKHCARPSCLTPLTTAEHAAVHALRPAECKNGHEFTPANTYWRKGSNGQPSRQCRRCKADVEARRVAAMSPEQREERVRKIVENRRKRTGWKKRPESRY